jgi:DNA-binding CsgD family transcriptional regulator
MERLTEKDIGALMECIRDIYSAADIETFPSSILSAVSRLIPSESITYNEITPQGNRVAYKGIDSIPQKDLRIFERYVHEHPLVNLLFPAVKKPHPFKRQLERKYYNQPLEGKALKISDALTDSQLHSLGLYNELYKKYDTEYQMSLPFYDSSSVVILIGISLNRKLRDFSEMERHLLNLLSPHIVRAYHNAKVFTEVKRQASISRGIFERIDSGFLVMEMDGRVKFATKRAEDLLAKYFNTQFNYLHHLPGGLEQWVKDQQSMFLQKGNIPSPQSSFKIEGEKSRLLIRFIKGRVGEDDILVLKEEAETLSPQALESLGLTYREGEVLYWVAQGKTNSEIALLLNISLRTVHKHIERIYQKLGVENRTSATLLVLDK